MIDYSVTAQECHAHPSLFLQFLYSGIEAVLSEVFSAEAEVVSQAIPVECQLVLIAVILEGNEVCQLRVESRG